MLLSFTQIHFYSGFTTPPEHCLLTNGKRTVGEKKITKRSR